MGTSFENMSHEQMLAWLDQANSGAVQGAADRLLSAAKKIREIGEDLKVRPQMVEWKGEGADAFRTWSADLANSTLRLGKYSEGASEWLGRASEAIASAQVAIPRTHAGAAANLAAAKEARNDPDASSVAQEAAATLIADKEANRQEAAAQMRKLAESYAFSSSQIKGLEKPVFPPPPAIIVPEDQGNLDSESGDYSVGGAGTGGAAGRFAGSATTYTHGPESQDGQVTLPGVSTSSPLSHAAVARPVDMEIDSVATLPDAPTVPSTTPPSLPSGGKPDGGYPPVVGAPPPAVGRNPALPPATSGGGKVSPSIRPPVSGLGNPGPTTRPPATNGISGGRQVPQTSGRPTGGLPRGNVIGNENTHGGRAPMGHGPGMGGGAANQSGIVGGRRLAGETGGIVGGRPQQPGHANARPFTPGGTGLVRGSSDGGRASGPMGRGGAGVTPRSGDSRRDEGSDRPDYLLEDEETWQQGGRRVVPPVID